MDGTRCFFKFKIGLRFCFEILFSSLPAVLVLLDEGQVAGHHRGGAVRHEGEALLLARRVEVVEEDAADAPAHAPVRKVDNLSNSSRTHLDMSRVDNELT